jgi:polyribonucleotide nucleotidyltransferase
VTDVFPNGQPRQHHEVTRATAVIDNGARGTREITFETGRLARQAGGSATVRTGDTVLLATTAASRGPKEHLDFFPLTVDVEERLYAVGRIPGSFFRREGRPGEDAILTCRLIDRPLRPSFAKGLRNEVQVVVTVLSLDEGTLYDVVAINAASASTMLAGLPFSGPIGATRVAFIDGEWVAFPTHDELERATFDMVVAGRVLETASAQGGEPEVAIMMVEAEATTSTIALVRDGSPAPTEDVVAQGLEAAKPAIRALCAAQVELAAGAAKPTAEFPRYLDYSDEVYAAVESAAGDEVAHAITIAGKAEREAELDRIDAELMDRLGDDFEGQGKEIKAALRALTKKAVRARIVASGQRIDGRGLRDIRPLYTEVGVLPLTHGSALFERGETQVLGVTTLNMLRMEQIVDTLSPDRTKRYMHNYNMPPYSTGETGRVGSPKRREIGHGALAERAILPVLPSREEFPYAIRQVSEAISSNGSTSMGSVCAASMSLMSAGVPLRSAVAGIAMGLVYENDTYVTLTDILGAEDAFGDMDFKVAGTDEFVTALQLDTKLDGIPSEVLAAALTQAREARLTILGTMAAAITGPGEMAPTAPRIIAVKVPVDKIGEIIGPKGKTINEMQEQTGADITVEDDGTVYVGAADGAAAQQAVDRINAIANPVLPQVGERYHGKVVKTLDFGAFVSLTPGKDGLVHISKLGGGKRLERVEDAVKEGDTLHVEVVDIDSRGKISLTPVDEEGNLVQVPERPRREGGSRDDRDRGPRRDSDSEGRRPRRRHS